LLGRDSFDAEWNDLRTVVLESGEDFFQVLDIIRVRRATTS
jgi:hypothetical protein